MKHIVFNRDSLLRKGGSLSLVALILFGTFQIGFSAGGTAVSGSIESYCSWLPTAGAIDKCKESIRSIQSATSGMTASGKLQYYRETSVKVDYAMDAFPKVKAYLDDQLGTNTSTSSQAVTTPVQGGTSSMVTPGATSSVATSVTQGTASDSTLLSSVPYTQEQVAYVVGCMLRNKASLNALDPTPFETKVAQTINYWADIKGVDDDRITSGIRSALQKYNASTSGTDFTPAQIRGILNKTRTETRRTQDYYSDLEGAGKCVVKPVVRSAHSPTSAPPPTLDAAVAEFRARQWQPSSTAPQYCQGESTIALQCGNDRYARYGWDGENGAHWCKNGSKTDTLPSGGNFLAAGCSKTSGYFTTTERDSVMSASQGTSTVGLDRQKTWQQSGESCVSSPCGTYKPTYVSTGMCGNGQSGPHGCNESGVPNPPPRTVVWSGDCHFGGKVFYPTRSTSGQPAFGTSQAALIGSSGVGKYRPANPGILEMDFVFGIADNAFYEISSHYESWMGNVLGQAGSRILTPGATRQDVIACWLKEFENDPGANDVNAKNQLQSYLDGTKYVPDARINQANGGGFGCFGYVEKQYYCNGVIAHNVTTGDGSRLNTGDWSYNGLITKFRNGSICMGENKDVASLGSTGWQLNWDGSVLANPAICQEK